MTENSKQQYFHACCYEQLMTITVMFAFLLLLFCMYVVRTRVVLTMLPRAVAILTVCFSWFFKRRLCFCG